MIQDSTFSGLDLCVLRYTDPARRLERLEQVLLDDLYDLSVDDLYGLSVYLCADDLYDPSVKRGKVYSTQQQDRSCMG